MVDNCRDSDSDSRRGARRQMGRKPYAWGSQSARGATTIHQDIARSSRPDERMPTKCTTTTDDKHEEAPTGIEPGLADLQSAGRTSPAAEKPRKMNVGAKACAWVAPMGGNAASLARIVAALNSLPEAARQAILARVENHSPTLDSSSTGRLQRWLSIPKPRPYLPQAATFRSAVLATQVSFLSRAPSPPQT